MQSADPVGSDLVSQRATDPFATMLESEGPGQ